MTSRTVTMSRDLAERLLSDACNESWSELNRLLAIAPEAPRQFCDCNQGRLPCNCKVAPLSPDHSGGGAGVVLPEPITVYLPPRVPVVVPKSPSEATSEYMMGAAYNMAIDNCQKQIEAAGGKVKELNQ